MNIRTTCVICQETLPLASAVLEDMPISACSVDKPTKYEYYPMRFSTCTKCGTIQLTHLVPLDKVYSGENKYTVPPQGKTWKEHEEAFADFIRPLQYGARYLEIGGSTGSLFARLKGYMAPDDMIKWDIVDLNPSPAIEDKRLRFIKGSFLDIKNLRPCNAVIMSHVFEHFHNPRKALLKIRSCGFGPVFLSFPVFSKKSIMHNINFEHTYAATPETISLLFSGFGYSLVKISRFKNHSTFLMFEQNKNTLNIKWEYEYIKDFSSIINPKIANHSGPVYLWGAHFPIQYMRSAGLDTSKITALLDNSPDKIGRYLYGFDTPTKHPSVLEAQDNAIVIVKMGEYSEEIQNQIRSINPKVKVII